MRIQIMCGMVLLGTVLFGQRSLPVRWKTTNGTIGTAYLKKMPFQLEEEEQLVFYQQDRDSILTLPDQLDWVIYQGDTLLTRHVHNGYPKLMRLLYQGDIRLYKVIQDWTYEQYYLVKGEQWELLSHLKAKEAGYRILRQNCHQFQPINKIRNEYQAIEVARQINHCIGEAKHYPMPGFENYRHQLGVSYAIPGKPYSMFDDRRTAYNYSFLKSIRYYWPVYVPAVSLFYQRQVFRNRPWLKAQINLQSGVQMGITKNIHLAFNFRIESLSQHWRYRETTGEEIFYSNVFPYDDFLAKRTNIRLQVQTAYSW